MPKGDGVDDQQKAARLGTPFQQMLGLRWNSDPGTDEIIVQMDLRPELFGPAGSLEGRRDLDAGRCRGASCAVKELQRLVATRVCTLRGSSRLCPPRSWPTPPQGCSWRTQTSLSSPRTWRAPG
jgi:hypothetical protein